MPNLNDLEEMPRKVLNIFYVLDTSSSMEGEAISMLNSAMKEINEVLAEQAKSDADVLLKISVLQFNTIIKWMNPEGPQDAADFVFEDLVADGITQLGEALQELNDKLSKEKFLKSSTGVYVPIIIFMTDGIPTDYYKKELDKIRENKWYNKATKIGFAIGDCDKETIAQLVGKKEAVISTAELSIFKDLIKVVSTTASMLCSASHTTSNSVTGSDIVQQAIDLLDSEQKSLVDTDTSYELADLPVEDDDWGDDGDWN